MIGAIRDPRSGVEGQLEGTPTTAFGKYQLFASLGRGGMAEVFLAVARGQMGFHKLAVIKRLRQALAEEPAFRTMFLDEARLAARLNHPNIVHTYEVGEQNGVYFIAMEYLEGQALNAILKEAQGRQETLEPTVGARIIADALAGLAHAHTLGDYDGCPLGIIHRDVSPHNIFVSYDGHTKLVDFGIAKAALSSTETEVGVLKGKVSYMSPEQAMGGHIDQRADIFAMGIVLWEVLAQRRLMSGESAANTIHKLMNEPIPRLSSVMTAIDPALDAIVARSLERDPERRWQTAGHMRDALEDWLRVTPRPSRQEDIARKMQHLFANVREDVQRQIQRHMSAVTSATNTHELQALTAESLERLERSGANVSGQLLRLNGSGSGSGVVASYGFGTRSEVPRPIIGSNAPPPAQKSSKALLIVIAVGFFVLAALLIVVIGLRDRRRVAKEDSAQTGATASATAGPSASAAPAAVASSAPSPESAETVASSAPSVSVALAASSAPSKTGRPGKTPSHTSAAAPPVVVEEKENGFLTINVYPWAKVSEGGRVLCAATPCNKIPLSPGTHTLQLENAEQGMKQSTVVTIKSGDTTTRAIGFK